MQQMSISSRSPAFPPRNTADAGKIADGSSLLPPSLPAILPPCAPGMRIGLFGGTFNPPHEGHRLASLIALRRLRLSSVWWLVTPGNPLKRNDGLPPMASRLAAARRMADHPRIAVTGLEADIDTRFTYDTVAWLVRRRPHVRFVWIMGADNLHNFHRWQRWVDIARLMPIAVVDRPESTLRGTRSRAASRFERWRQPESGAASFATLDPPAFVFLHGPRSDLSSTELRRRGLGLAASDPAR